MNRLLIVRRALAGPIRGSARGGRRNSVEEALAGALGERVEALRGDDRRSQGDEEEDGLEKGYEEKLHDDGARDVACSSLLFLPFPLSFFLFPSGESSLMPAERFPAERLLKQTRCSWT